MKNKEDDSHSATPLHNPQETALPSYLACARALSMDFSEKATHRGPLLGDHGLISYPASKQSPKLKSEPLFVNC